MISFPDSFTVISDEVSQDPRVVAAFATRHGLKGVELRSMFGRAFRDLARTDLREIGRIFRDEGLRIHGCATPVFKCDAADAAARREHRGVFQRSVEAADLLGAPLLRVFTFLRSETPAGEAQISAAADALGDLLELAPPRLRIGVENEASCVVGTADECRRLLALLPAPNVGLVWDPCNVLYVPGHRGPATEDFAALAPRILHIHAKDARRGPAATEACRIGDGEVDWRTHLREIRAAGYAGLISLETHWRHAALDQAALHLPAGQAFSEGGEAASEECMHALHRLLAQAGDAP